MFTTPRLLIWIKYSLSIQRALTVKMTYGELHTAHFKCSGTVSVPLSLATPCLRLTDCLLCWEVIAAFALPSKSWKKFFTFSVLQDRGLVLKGLSSVSDSSEDARLTWRNENRSPSLSSSVTAFSLLSSFYIQKREREKKNSVIQLIFLHKTSHGNSKATFILIIWTPTQL